MMLGVSEHRSVDSLRPSSYASTLSLAMSPVEQLLVRLGESELPILLLGEGGCGKRAPSRFVHDSSPRRAQPFVVMNAAGVTVQALDERIAGPGDALRSLDSRAQPRRAARSIEQQEWKWRPQCCATFWSSTLRSET
jgi:transcriptional regulator of acetoin/glycerol metabolism